MFFNVVRRLTSYAGFVLNFSLTVRVIEVFCCLEFARVLSSDILSGSALVRLLEHLVYVCMGWNVSPAKSISVVYFLWGNKICKRYPFLIESNLMDCSKHGSNKNWNLEPRLSPICKNCGLIIELFETSNQRLEDVVSLL